jgi:uncharacterized membrane protein (Fun14 family)
MILGYTIKKIVRVAAIIFGLFIAGLAFLQYQQIASINWYKIEGFMMGLTSAAVSTLNENSITSVMTLNFGVPLTSSMASGFTVGFLKG